MRLHRVEALSWFAWGCVTAGAGLIGSALLAMLSALIHQGWRRFSLALMSASILLFMALLILPSSRDETFESFSSSILLNGADSHHRSLCMRGNSGSSGIHLHLTETILGKSRTDFFRSIPGCNRGILSGIHCVLREPRSVAT